MLMKSTPRIGLDVGKLIAHYIWLCNDLDKTHDPHFRASRGEVVSDDGKPDLTVEFEANGVKIIINAASDAKQLTQAWLNASTAERITAEKVGP